MPSMADLTGIRAMTVVEALTPTANIADAARESLDRLALLEIGRQIPAQVVAQLDDGSYLAKFDQTTVNLNLPAQTQVGDQITLTVLENSPKPTFLLNAQAPQPGTDTTTLSHAAQQINLLVQADSDGIEAKAVQGRTPVLAQPSDHPPEIAHSLHDTLTYSGLFYESHLQDWVNGQRSMQQIQREPQMQAHATQQNQTPSTATAPQQQTANTVHNDLIKIAQQSIAGEKSAAAGSANVVSPAAGNFDTTRNMQLQLHTLDHNMVAWHGELWPGQKMEWEVRQQASSDGKNPSPEDPVWQSTVRFAMPTLGNVAATLDLQGNRLRIAINAVNADSAERLTAHSQDLIAALQATGTTLDHLVINKDANT